MWLTTSQSGSDGGETSTSFHSPIEWHVKRSQNCAKCQVDTDGENGIQQGSITKPMLELLRRRKG
jgi:hypothetical protein